MTRYVLTRAALGSAVLLLVAWAVLTQGYAQTIYHGLGHDYETYIGAARDWLAGRGFYEAYQLAGPYAIVEREILYPPPILALLVPFTVLPWFLWWAIPLGVVAWIVWSYRPSRLGCAGIVACLAWPETIAFPATGNPGIWIMAAVAAGTRWGWPAVFVLLKPTVAPFALLALRDRKRALLAGVGLAAFSVAFLPLWGDYLTVVQNATNGSLLYSLGRDTPLLLIPVVALATQQRQQDDRGVGLRVVQRAVAVRRGQGHERVAPELPEVAESL